MSSWEGIANEVAPLGYKHGALATGARRFVAIDDKPKRTFIPLTNDQPIPA